MYEVTKLIPQKHLSCLMALLPSPRQQRRGRKRVKKEALVNGILQHMVNGVAWGKIAPCGCSYPCCFRYFKNLQRRGFLKLIFKALARQKVDLTLGSIDTTTVPSFEFRHGTGYDGHHHVVGTKVSLYVDQNGRPVDCLFAKGNLNDRRFVSSHLDNTKGKRKKILNLDMKYMGLDIRRNARKHGVRVNMKVRTQDYQRKRGPKFAFVESQYNQRFNLERTNGWLKNFRSLRLRREYHFAMFKALVYLALIIILIRY